MRLQAAPRPPLAAALAAWPLSWRPCGGRRPWHPPPPMRSLATAAAAVAPAPLGVQEARTRLQLHNTMTRGREPFAPRPDAGDAVTMYVCGVTVYDYSHIGHARVYCAFDVLYRLLQHLRYQVTYVRNFTDVDDKIIRRAAERGEDPLALAGRFISEFHVDMAALGCLPPSAEPRATDHIPAMVTTIQTIIANGHAYAVEGGDVFFDVASLPGYGRLSGRAQEDNRAGERVAVDPRKRGAADFALWKAAKPGEPSWESPWGRGRPGWHIECSAMIRALMGPVIDIHGGGADLVFPHHENELAQSQAAAACCGDAPHLHRGTDFVRYWLHNGFVNVDSEKMSKSLGNFFTIRDVCVRYHPRALRWFLVSTHYRAPVNYTQRALDEASDRAYYVYQALSDADAALEAAGDAGRAAAEAEAAEMAAGRGAAAALVGAALGALCEDLNTPAVLAELSAPLRALNDLLTTKAGRKNPRRLRLLAAHRVGVAAVLHLLGLDPGSGLETLLGELRARALVRAGLTEEAVAAAIEARAAARAGRDFAAADAVRAELAAKGVLIMDAPGGTTWRPGVAASAEAA